LNGQIHHPENLFIDFIHPHILPQVFCFTTKTFQLGSPAAGAGAAAALSSRDKETDYQNRLSKSFFEIEMDP
jgi:hypothetical protein